MSAHAYANHYRKTSVDSAVLDADPHRLVSLMLAGLRQRLQLGAACIESGHTARKGQAITEASTLVAHLDASLNHDAGGEVADNLAALYDYIQRRLLAANADNDASPLRECDELVASIEGAWNSIAPGQPAMASAR